MKVRKKRRKKPSEEEWQLDAEEDRSEANERRGNVIWQLIASGVLFAGTILVIAWVMRTKPDQGPANSPQSGAKVLPEEEMVVVQQDEDEEEVSLWYDKDEVETLVGDFLEAETVDELLPLVRNRSGLEEKIRSYYKSFPLEAPGFRRASVNQVFQDDHGNAMSMSVSTKGYDVRPISVVETGDGPRVDWESWVGHGDVSWQELLEQKPVEPVKMRVVLSDVNYYNRLFSDDQIWKSLRLASADEENVIYGYVKIGSEAADDFAKLIGVIQGGQCRAIVELRYPEDAVSSKQVELKKLVAGDWLVRETNDE